MASINPITVSRLKTFVLQGHSNADGWGSTDRLFSPNNHLDPKSGQQANEANNRLLYGDLGYWEDVYVFTSAQPFPGTLGTPVATTPGQGEWLEMTIANTWSPGDAHPHASPYDYPNNQGAFYARYLYTAWPGSNIAILDNATFSPDFTPNGTWFNQNNQTTPYNSTSHTYGTRHGVEIPFAYHWRHHWQDQVGVVKLALSSSLFLRTEPGIGVDLWVDPQLFPYTTLTGGSQTYTPLSYAPSYFTPSHPAYVRAAVNPDYGFYACWTPRDRFDWAPAAGGLYELWYQKMVGAAAALAAANPGAKLDVQCVIPWFLDNEAGTRNEIALRNTLEHAIRGYVERIRTDLVVNDWTTLPKSQIPILWPKVHYAYVGVGATSTFSPPDFCNEILAKIAADDPYFEVIETWDLELLSEAGSGNVIFGVAPGSHFSSGGYVTMADRLYETWVDMRGEAYDALDPAKQLTVSQLKDRVKSYYTRGRSSTDVEDDELLLQHINGAMYHVLNLVGDNAYWLRRRKKLTLNIAPNQTYTMPRYVHRLLMIEDPSDQTYPIWFEQVGHTDGGKLQIIVNSRTSGSYYCSFITIPPELTKDGEMVPLPWEMLEWVVVEASLRLARAGTNMVLLSQLQGESLRLQQDALRHMGQTQRSKRDRMRTQRRNFNIGYSRQGLYNRWGNDSSR